MKISASTSAEVSIRDDTGLPGGLPENIYRLHRRATLAPDDHAETDDGYGVLGVKDQVMGSWPDRSGTFLPASRGGRLLRILQFQRQKKFEHLGGHPKIYP